MSVGTFRDKQPLNIKLNLLVSEKQLEVLDRLRQKEHCSRSTLLRALLVREGKRVLGEWSAPIGSHERPIR
jgi:hypothetical protein